MSSTPFYEARLARQFLKHAKHAITWNNLFLQQVVNL